MRVDHAEIERGVGDVGISQGNKHSPVNLVHVSVV